MVVQFPIAQLNSTEENAELHHCALISSMKTRKQSEACLYCTSELIWRIHLLESVLFE